MIKAIFFDSGNVLASDGFTAGITIYEKRHHLPSGLLYHSAHDRKYWQDFTLGYISENEYLNKVVEDFGGQMDIKEFNNIIYEHSVPNRKLLEFVKTLKPQYFLGIISNNPKEWFDYFWKAFGWNKVFDSKSVSADLHVRKPAPEIFQDALHKAQIRGPEAVYIDDRPDRVLGAKQVGMKIIIYQDVAQLKKDLATITKK